MKILLDIFVYFIYFFIILFKIQKKYSILNIQYSIFNNQYSIFNIQYSIFNIQYSIFNIQYSIFNIQYYQYSIFKKNITMLLTSY